MIYRNWEIIQELVEVEIEIEMGKGVIA